MSTYLRAGVNLEGAASWVKQLKTLIPGIGGFGGIYPLGENDLVASTDGVGTKIKLAILRNDHSTIGIDLVAMNVNDILTTGAKPLFFLDYLAVSKLEPAILPAIVHGISQGCEEAGCALIGGETAQMPSLYREGDYDMAGFAVGVVKRATRIDGSRVQKGDQIIGLPSSGVHSNGFSLISQIVGEDQLLGELGETLLTPTRIYVKQVQELICKYPIKGMAHITGGGFAKNIPRAMPNGLTACIREGSWPVPDIFSYLQKVGEISLEEMRRVFNRGIGFVLILPPEEGDLLCRSEEGCFLIGEVIEGERPVWQ